MKREYFITSLAKKVVFLPFFAFFITCGHAQNSGLDSTLRFLSSYKSNDSLKIKALLNASTIYQTSNLQKASYYANQAMEVSQKNNDPYFLALSMSRLASVDSWNGKSTDALGLYLKEVDVAKSLGSNYLLQDAYDGLAYVYETEEEWDASLQYSLKSLAIAEKSATPKDAAYPYHQLGSVYLGMGDGSKAEQYLKKAQSIFINTGDTERIALCDADLAKVYANLHYYNLARTYFDSALQLFTEWREPLQVAEVYQQYGNMALHISEYGEAENYFNRAMEIYRVGAAAGTDSARALIGLGEVALSRGDYKKALGVLKDEYEKIKAAGDKNDALECLLNITGADSATGNFKEAYYYLQKYRQLYNEVYNEKKNRATQRMLIELDVERQNNENRILKTKYEQQEERQQAILFAGGFVLLAAILLVLLYRQKNSAYKHVEKLQAETSEKNRAMLVSNSVKDKLLSMIAHDVRSPLASVQNTLTLMREEMITKDDFATLSQMMEMDIQHLTGMLDNTLMWAREQMVDIPVNKTVFNIGDVIGEVIYLYEQTLESKNIKVINNIAPGTEVASDKDIITTVLRNIISNAIKFTPNGKTIHIGQTSIKSKVLVTVKDEGVGISDAVLKKINDKEFVSTRGTENEKGTGLGLLFSRDLLRKLGEDFQISSVPGKGTAVTISINTKK